MVWAIFFLLLLVIWGLVGLGFEIEYMRLLNEVRTGVPNLEN